MRLVRWPAVSVMLACIIAAFFFVGQSGNTVVRPMLEQIASNEFATPAHVGDLKLSVYGSCIAASDLLLADPGNPARPLFAARTANLRADFAGFFERRAVISQAHLEHAALRLNQKRTGGLAFLSDTAQMMLRYEPASVRLQRILSWTTDQINPLKAFPALPGSLARAPVATNDAAESGQTAPPTTRAPDFRLRLPHERAEVVLEELTVADSTLELIPFGHTNGIVLSSLDGACTGLSTNPRKHDEPIRFVTKGIVEGSSDAWFDVGGTVGLMGGETNILLNFTLSNMPVAAVLPFARTYTRHLDALVFESGFITAHGTVQMDNGVVTPSTIFLRADDLTVHADRTSDELGPELSWMQYLSLSNSMFELAVPLDNKKPYFHVDEALKKQDFKLNLKNIQIKLDIGKDGKNLLNGFIDKSLLENKRKKR